jgi:hypothetical protein
MDMLPIFSKALISDTIDHYIHNAIRVATKGEFRDRLIDQIREKQRELFDDATVVEEWSEMLQNLHRYQ